MRKAVILGCQGSTLTKEELRLYKKIKPLGFILFRQNCVSVKQIRKLINQLREVLEDDCAPVMIDQEGGAVCRLAPPNWPPVLPFADFGAIYKQDKALAKNLFRLNCRAISGMLSEVGINSVASPCLDLFFPFASRVIDRRSFGSDPKLVSDLGRVAVDTFLSANITPIIKHLIGHGRALVDSHKELPYILEPLSLLQRTDFVPFKDLKDCPWGMCAHIVYRAIDPKEPLSVSKAGLSFIKRELGYSGVLITDSINMHALRGELVEKTKRAFSAGIDIVLCTSGLADEYEALLKVADPLSAKLEKKLKLSQPVYKAQDGSGCRIDYRSDLKLIATEADKILPKRSLAPDKDFTERQDTI